MFAVVNRGAVAITGIAAVTPIGLSAIETAASVRAGNCCFREDGVYQPIAAERCDPPGPVMASAVATLPRSAVGAARVFELVLCVLRDLLRQQSIAGAAEGFSGNGTGWFLALPEEDAVTASWGLAKTLGPALLDRFGDGDARVASVSTQGGAGSLAILGHAAESIRNGSLARAVVVAADTFIDRDRLALLDRDRRIKLARSSAGMVPGEGATALVLEGAADALRRRVRVLATLGEVGTGVEPQTAGRDRESSGRGLTHALRAALAGGAAHAPRWILCNLNGETYRAAEWGTASARLARELSGGARISLAADCVGEIGAAIGGVMIAQAIDGFARGYAPAPEALLWAGCDASARAAVRVLAPASWTEG